MVFNYKIIIINLLSKIFFIWWLWIYIFSALYLIRVKLALVVRRVEPQTFCLGFWREHYSLLQQEHCSTLTIQYIVKNRRFITISPIYQEYIRKYCWFLAISPKISPEWYFSTKYRFHTLRYTKFRRYIANISLYFLPWMAVTFIH